MEIRASSRRDMETAKEFSYVVNFRSTSPLSTVIFLGVAFLTTWAVSAFILFKLYSSGRAGAFPAVLIIMVMAFVLLLFLYAILAYFKMPKRQYEFFGYSKDAEISYLFEDDTVTEYENAQNSSGNTTINYATLKKVYESNKRLYIYIDKVHVLIVDKSTITGGSVDELRDKLRDAVGKNYVVCKS